MGVRWKEQELQEPIKLIKEGFTYSEIENIINKPANCIRVKLQKSGIKYSDYHTAYINKQCKQCDINFKSRICEKKFFCTHYCAALFNAKLKEIKRICVFCNQIRNNNNKFFCSRICEHKYKKRNKI